MKGDDSFIELYLSFLNSSDTEILKQSLSCLKEFLDIVETKKCRAEILQILRELITSNPKMKKPALKQLLFIINYEDDENEKQFLIQYIMNYLTSEDIDTKLYLMLQFEELKRTIGYEKLVQIIIVQIIYWYEEFDYDQKLIMIEIIKLILKFEGLLMNQNFQKMAKTKILKDPCFKIRLDFIACIFEVEGSLSIKEFDKHVISMFIGFITDDDYRLRINLIMFLYEHHFRISESRWNKIVHIIIDLYQSDTNGNTKDLCNFTLKKIYDRISSKRVKVS